MSSFFQLIRLSIDASSKIPSLSLSPSEWEEIFQLAQKQTLAGVLLEGIMRLPDEQKPPMDLLMQWYVIASKIKQYNQVLDKQAALVCKRFLRDGFQSVILKGQGNALLYPDPSVRQPGDIDIWIGKDRDTIVNYLRQHCTISQIVYHHADFPVLEDTEVEVHFTPTWMNSYFTNKILQKFFKEMAPLQFANEATLPNGGKINVPTLQCNLVYLLVHIYRHLFDEGIGLRQLLDYYFLLRNGITEKERTRTLQVLRELKMLRFTAAVMYVEQEVFGVESHLLLMPPDEKAGRFLLEEIMEAGNFGKFDPRIKHRQGESRPARLVRKTLRNLRFIQYYPSEVLWEPFFKVWQFCWRKVHGYL